MKYKYRYTKNVSVEDAMLIETFVNHFGTTLINQIKESLATEVEQTFVHDSSCNGWGNQLPCNCFIKDVADLCRKLDVS
jgi:hypothetical protein